MLRKFLVFCALASALSSQAIIWHCDNFDTSKKVCRLKSWSGSQPSSGKLTLPTTFKHTDGKEYTVVSVAPHALDDLTDVTEITIPAQISAIGDQKATTGLIDYTHRVKNFENCPNLTTFKVASGNPTFSADDSGLLLTVDGNCILRVPTKIKTSNGAFTIREDIDVIGENSFMENTSIKSLYLPTEINIYQNGGLNDTKNLAEYHFSGAGSSVWQYPLRIEGNCLLEHEYSGYTAVSVPPASTRQTLTLSSDVVTVGKNAFKNTKNLKTVDLGKVKYIHERIIENSAVETINIPSTVINIKESALRNAPKLTALTLEAADLEIPKDFARDCPMLERISSKKNITYLNSRAFMNCVSLIQFPFSTSTNCFWGDSIFFNTGFKKVTFADSGSKATSDVNRDALSNAMFSNCEALHTIDLSGVTDTEKEPLSLPNPLAKKCEKLKRVIFPPFSIFWGDDDKDHQPAFNTTILSEIELGTFQNTNNGTQFRYTPINGKTEFTPNVYLCLTRNRNLDPKNYKEMPLLHLFEGVNGAKVVPNFYCDLYAPKDDVYTEYVAERGIYYVPGGCADNYSEVKQSGRQVKQMFKFSLTKSGSQMIAKTFKGEVEVTDMRATVNGSQTIRMNIGEEYGLPVDFKDVTSVLLRYKVNDVELSTLYPPSFWDQSGVGSAYIDDIDADRDASYILYDLSGCRVAEGCGDFSSEGIAAGVYILIRGDKREKIVVK